MKFVMNLLFRPFSFLAYFTKGYIHFIVSPPTLANSLENNCGDVHIFSKIL